MLLLLTTVDGGIMPVMISINLNEQPIEIEGDVIFGEMKIRPKECIIQ